MNRRNSKDHRIKLPFKLDFPAPRTPEKRQGEGAGCGKQEAESFSSMPGMLWLKVSFLFLSQNVHLKKSERNEAGVVERV